MLTVNFKSSAQMFQQNYIPSAAKSPMKVLLVEDSILIRNALIEILNSTNNLYVDSTASTQKDAIALLNKKQFDMMLIDIELAEGNGFEMI